MVGRWHTRSGLIKAHWRIWTWLMRVELFCELCKAEFSHVIVDAVCSSAIELHQEIHTLLFSCYLCTICTICTKIVKIVKIVRLVDLSTIPYYFLTISWLFLLFDFSSTHSLLSTYFHYFHYFHLLFSSQIENKNQCIQDKAQHKTIKQMY